MKGLAIRRHHEKRIKRAAGRYQELEYLFVGTDIKYSVFNLADREARAALGKACNRHGSCRCGRDHGLCSRTDKELANIHKPKGRTVQEELRLMELEEWTVQEELWIRELEEEAQESPARKLLREVSERFASLGPIHLKIEGL